MAPVVAGAELAGVDAAGALELAAVDAGGAELAGAAELAPPLLEDEHAARPRAVAATAAPMASLRVLVTGNMWILPIRGKKKGGGGVGRGGAGGGGARSGDP